MYWVALKPAQVSDCSELSSKQAAVQQNMVANLLEQNPMPEGSNFSTYA
jgi:hypothetical protein